MSRFAAATRPARRELFHHPWRILAGLLLIALPVGIVVWSFMMDQSHRDYDAWTSSPRSIACTQPSDYSSPSDMPAHFPAACNSDSLSSSEAIRAFRAEAKQVLPDGLDVTPVGKSSEAVMDLKGRSWDGQLVTQFEADSPPSGAARLWPKDAAPAPNEIALDKRSAKELGAKVGDTISVRVPLLPAPTTFRVVSITPASQAYAAVSREMTESVPVLESRSHAVNQFDWQIVGSPQLTREDVAAAAEEGFSVYDRDLPSDPTLSSTPTPKNHVEDALWLLFWFGVYGCVAVLILLLISPVFTLVMGRNTRLYALMASQGARPRDIALSVLSAGALTGALGAALGVVGAIATGTVFWAIMYPGFAPTIPWLNATVAFLIAVFGSTAASSVPAWLAARNSLARAINSGAGDRIVAWKRWMWLGPIAIVLVPLSTVFAWARTMSPIIALLEIIAIVASTPAILFALNKLLDRGPLALRTASRGLLRRSLHALPATAAVLALTFTLTTFSVHLASQDAFQQAKSDEVVPPTNANLSISTYAPDDESTERKANEKAAAAALSVVPGRSTEIRGVPSRDDVIYDDEAGQLFTLRTQYDYECKSTAGPSLLGGPHYGRDPFIDNEGRNTDESQEARDFCARELLARAYSSPDYNYFSSIVQATPEDLYLWQFASDADRQRAAEVLNKGGVVVARGRHMDNTDKAAFTTTFRNEKGSEIATKTAVELPVAAALPTAMNMMTILSPEASKKLGLQPNYLGTIVSFDRVPSDRQQDRIAEEIRSATNSNKNIWFKTTYTNYSWVSAVPTAIICLVVLLLVLALSRPSIRRENNVYESIGAPPSFPAKVSALQTWLIGTVGMLGGALAGHAAQGFAIAVIDTPYGATNGALKPIAYLQPDWWMLLAALVVPAAAAAAAWAVHTRTSADLISPERGETEVV